MRHEFVLKNTAGMLNENLQKQFPIGVRQNSFSANIQQIYRRTPVRIYDLNNVGLQLFWTRTSAWVFSCIFAAYLYNTFLKITYGKLPLNL